jgi:HK97 family phage major capsid protein/HK97 family phage prohead protease
MNKEFQRRDISFGLSISENGEFEGYISTYYDVDSYGTYFMPGAWDKSIERFNSGEVIPVLWSHDRTKPIGKCTELRSDEKGLWAHGKLTMEDPQAQTAYAHMKDGSVMGLSVGFEMDYDSVEYNQDLDAYGIADADLMEYSVVVFPANPNAKITQVKSSHDHDIGENDMNLKDQIDAMNKAIEDIRAAANSASDAEISKRDTEISELKKQIAQLSNPITGTAQTEDPSKQYEKNFHTYLKTGNALNLRNDPVAGSEGTNANGGYICPDGLDKRVVELLTPRSTIRRNATIIVPAGKKYERPYKKTGITSGWVGETSARTATDAQTYDMISAEVGELYAFPQYTQNFLADTWYNVEQGFARDLAISFADKEEAAFVSGDGSNKPNGILAALREAKDDTQRTWNKLQQINTESATGITLNSLYAIKDSLNYAYRSNAKWYMSTSTYTALQQALVDGEQRGIFGRGDVSQNMPETLLGYPIEIDDYMPAVAANACPIVFGDMRQGYAILERPGIGVLRDMYSNKPYIGLYSIKRGGGLIQDYRALKVLCVAVTSA